MTFRDILPTWLYVVVSNDAWVVGSAAVRDADQVSVKDINIMVPHHVWHYVAPHIPKRARPNSFGGWKFTTMAGVDVDIWPDSLERLISRPKFKTALHLKSGTCLIKGD